MSNDKSDRGGRPVLTTLREMLGLEGEAFTAAMKEAVWVPGGVDQLADMIIGSLSVEDQYRLTRELPDVPEVMALIGRLLIALNDHPKRQALGEEVISRAQRLGDSAIQYLSPHSWYPAAEKIRTVLVSPTRLVSSTLVLRMLWGDEFEGIEAVWLLRFAAGDRGEVYFSTDDADKSDLDEMSWMTLTMKDALRLIAAVEMVQSATSKHFPFDGMAGVGLWMVLTRGRDVRPWIDGSYALQAEPVSPQEVALAALNALNAGDYLAAYDLQHPNLRPPDILEYLQHCTDERPRSGDLWRLDAGPVDERNGGAAAVMVRAWFQSAAGLIDRAYDVELTCDEAGHWRITRLDLVDEQAVGDSARDQYLANHLRYYVQLPVLDMEELADLMPGSPVSQSGGAVHFVAGPDMDYRRPYDVARSQELTWTVNLNSNLNILVSGSNELLLRREVVRLQSEGAVGDIVRSGTMNLDIMDKIQEAATNGSDRLTDLLDAEARR